MIVAIRQKNNDLYLSLMTEVIMVAVAAESRFQTVFLKRGMRNNVDNDK